MIKKNIFNIFLFLILGLTAVNAADVFPADKMCVLIYFDEASGQNYNLGKLYSIQLRNLLGHFPEVQQIVSPIERYNSGDLNKCRSAIYLGSYFDNKVPKTFLDDFSNATTNVAWLGYNIWQLPEDQQKSSLGYTYNSLTKIDYNLVTEDGFPGFFRYFKYKGETFKKFVDWVGGAESKTIKAAEEMIQMQKSEDFFSKESEVLSTAVHSLTSEEIPYVIRKKNKFYIADMPFSYIHEADRYLIFCDILFDILSLPPKQTKKLAVLRLEDVHALTDLWHLKDISDLLVEEKVPINIALIPIFYDPLSECYKDTSAKYLEMTDNPEFMSWIEDAKSKDAFFIWHGVTHQYNNVRNPHSGCSSSDFEFWDIVNNKSIAEDSSPYVLNRLNTGAKILAKAGIYPKVWLTPHYQASALDYRLFAKVFDWNIGRVVYFLDKPNQNLHDVDTENLVYSRPENLDSNYRQDLFKDFTTTVESNWVGQLFPYEIYSDVYGQKVIPEILGNPQPFVSAHVVYPRTIEEMLADAKRNLVLRDAWASMFFHPYLLISKAKGGLGEYDGDIRPLQKLVRGIKDLGYEFTHLDDFISSVEKYKIKEMVEL